ncbi:MAG: MerR family transcriptional regulator [Clostridiaceae bacterium]|jgi:DNA-binding transcriptional MerR regulator|nr:MerR family transcriptional regulator [Clostridiaceae bacterium]
MIKIKEFANLCQCSTQTLRYYDRIKLLSPAYVDDENGYRYYERNQLYDYIKIKNLQLADFSIAEIKNLLKSSDEEIYQAFDEKINSLKDRLAKTLKIKETYRIENNMIKKFLQLIKENFKEVFRPELVKQEYNLNDAQLNTYVEEWEEMFTNALVNEDMAKNFAESGLTEEQMVQVMEKFKTSNFKPDNKFDASDYTVLQEFHGWKYLHEIMDDLCALVKNGDDIIYYLEVNPDKLELTFTLPTVLLQTVLRQNPEKSLKLECQIQTSPDHSNHVYILDNQNPAQNYA